MQLAKALPHPDLLTAYAILKDDQLLDRLAGVSKINPWLDLAFGQLMSTKESEKTVDSIRGTASLVFGKLSTKEILTSITGRSTLTKDLSGKKLIIFGVKQDIRLVVAPLLATVLNILVTKNVKHGRQESLFVSLDELPTLYLPHIVEWLAENRKYGQCTMIGYQSFKQLTKTYGAETAEVIFSNTATKFLFNPQSEESAKKFSSMLGETDVSYKTRSRTWGKSRTISDHRGLRPLMRPEEFQGFGEGSCILLSPGYNKDRRYFLPAKFDPIEITDYEKRLEAASIRAWDGFLEAQIKKGIGVDTVTTAEITKRIGEFQEALPVIKTESKNDFVKNHL